MALLDRGVASAAAVTLALSRGSPGQSTCYGTIEDAVVGRTVFKMNDIGSAAITFGERDYLIPVASYVLDGSVVEPMVGDRFIESIGGSDLTFEIMPITGEPAWRHSDPTRTRYRIHVKRITDDEGR